MSWFTSFAFCFWKKFLPEKKSRNVRSYTRPTVQHTYAHGFRIHKNIYVAESRLSPSGFFGPSDFRCHGLIPTPGLNAPRSTPRTLCVCVYTHTYTNIHSKHNPKIEERFCMIHTKPLFFLIPVWKITSHASKSALHSWTPPPMSLNPNQETPHTLAHLHTLLRVLLQTCQRKLMWKTPVYHTYLHMHWWSRHLFTTLTAKNAHTPAPARPRNGAATS